MTLNPFALYKQIAALIKIKSEGGKLMEEIKAANTVAPGATKPGWKASEFWLGILGIGATIASAALPLVPGALPWVAGATATVVSVYVVARTIAKQTKTNKDDEFLDKLAAKIAPLIKLPPAAATEVVVVQPAPEQKV